MNRTAILVPAVLALLALAGPASAGEESLDVDTRFRAKIAKEKIRQAADERNSERRDRRAGDASDAECGSQQIGNVDTDSRPGRTPREVFVFAPNAINLVTAGSCR